MTENEKRLLRWGKDLAIAITVEKVGYGNVPRCAEEISTKRCDQGAYHGDYCHETATKVQWNSMRYVRLVCDKHSYADDFPLAPPLPPQEVVEAELPEPSPDVARPTLEQALHTTDAKWWAEAFIASFYNKKVGGEFVDLSNLISWFANAIDTGRVAGEKATAEHSLVLAVPPLPKLTYDPLTEKWSVK